MPLNQHNFLEKLVLQMQSLPGQKAQLKMSPFRVVDMKKGVPSTAKKSATMLLLYPKNEAIFSVLIQRTKYDGVHSKQIAFPGGKHDLEDENLEYTALRETLEEVGVSNITILGQLTEVYIEPSNFLVYPFVGYLNETPNFILQKTEVDDIIEYPISMLKDEIIVQKMKVETTLYGEFTVPVFNINDKKVWGATAAVLSEFKEILKNI